MGMMMTGCGKSVRECPVCEKPMEIYENAPVVEDTTRNIFGKEGVIVWHVWMCESRDHAIWATRHFSHPRWEFEGGIGRADAYISKESQ